MHTFGNCVLKYRKLVIADGYKLHQWVARKIELQCNNMVSCYVRLWYLWYSKHLAESFISNNF